MPVFLITKHKTRTVESEERKRIHFLKISLQRQPPSSTQRLIQQRIQRRQHRAMKSIRSTYVLVKCCAACTFCTLMMVMVARPPIWYSRCSLGWPHM